MRIGIYGFGAIGKLLALTAIKRGHEVVGVLDVRSELIGKDVGSLLGMGELGVKVSSDVDSLADADVVLHATGSFLDKVYNQLVGVAEMGIHVVSTCETLAYPYYRYPVLARELDMLARDYGSVIIGTGVNPGYIWDALVVTFGAALPSIKKITAIRSFDAAKRREAFRRKVGVGLSLEEFRKELSEGRLTAHVGYAESIFLISTAAGVQPSKILEHQEPVVAHERLESSGVIVERGLVAGVKGVGIGYLHDEEFVRLEFNAYVSAPEYDEILVEGEDRIIRWRCSGMHGDEATASIVLSVAENVRSLLPGLRLITELIPFKIRFTAKTTPFEA